MIEPPHLVGFVDRGDRHHRHQHVLVPDLGGIAREQRIDQIGLRARHHDIDPVAGHVDAGQPIDDLVDLCDDDAAAESRGLGDGRRVFGIGAGVEVAVAIGLVGDDQRHPWRQVDHHASIEFEIGMDRPDLHRPARDQFGELAALRSRESEIQPVRDAALEHSQMFGQCQHRLHHVQIVQPFRIGLRECGGQEIGLLLIIAFDRHAVARLGDRFEQLRRAVGGADFSSRAGERGSPRETGGAICAASWRVQHDGSPSLSLKRKVEGHH